jgi:predicted Fe-S protein YdhL (DUF1289 family)
MAIIQSPCEKICIIDPAHGLCRGCGRTLTEIECWIRFSDEERTAIMARLPERLISLSTGPVNAQVS